MNRRAFLKRSAVVGAALVLPPVAVAKGDPVAAMVPVRTPAKRMTEWWFESTVPDMVMINLYDGEPIIEIHYIKANGGIYVQFPPGRQMPLPTLVETEAVSQPGWFSTVEFRPVVRPSPYGARMGESAHGTFGMWWVEG